MSKIEVFTQLERGRVQVCIDMEMYSIPLGDVTPEVGRLLEALELHGAEAHLTT